MLAIYERETQEALERLLRESPYDTTASHELVALVKELERYGTVRLTVEPRRPR
jgi:hypothetical protein